MQSGSLVLTLLIRFFTSSRFSGHQRAHHQRSPLRWASSLARPCVGQKTRKAEPEPKDVIEDVVTTKAIGSNGRGLMVTITKEAGMLGVDRGDIVEVILRRRD